MSRGVDAGSARVRTATREQNEPLHRPSEAFRAATGTGVPADTSPNFQGHGFIDRMSDLAVHAVREARRVRPDRRPSRRMSRRFHCLQSEFNVSTDPSAGACGVSRRRGLQVREGGGGWGRVRAGQASKHSFHALVRHARPGRYFGSRNGPPWAGIAEGPLPVSAARPPSRRPGAVRAPSPAVHQRAASGCRACAAAPRPRAGSASSAGARAPAPAPDAPPPRPGPHRTGQIDRPTDKEPS